MISWCTGSLREFTQSTERFVPGPGCGDLPVHGGSGALSGETVATVSPLTTIVKDHGRFGELYYSADPWFS